MVSIIKPHHWPNECCKWCLVRDFVIHGSSAAADEPHKHTPGHNTPKAPGWRESLLQLLAYIYGTAEVKIVLARERSSWTSLTQVSCSDSSFTIQPDYIRKRLTKDFSLRSWNTVSIMTFGCRNAERQPKASPLSAKERVVVSLSEWYWMSIAWAQVLVWVSCETLFHSSLHHSSACENWLEVFLEVCWSWTISGLQVILEQTSRNRKRLTVGAESYDASTE